MRPTLLAALVPVALAACNGVAAIAPAGALPQTAARAFAQPPPAAAHHLYVAAAPFGSGAVGLQRFPLIDGKPTKNPDLVYPDASGPIAVGPDGSLYAADDVNFQTIDRFAPGSIKPASRLVAEPCGRNYLYDGLSAFTFDAKGDLYVGITAGDVPARVPHRTPVARNSSSPSTRPARPVARARSTRSASGQT